MKTPSRLALIDTAPVKMEYRKQFETEFLRRQNGMEVRRMRQELADSGLREKDPAEYKQRTFELAVAPYFADP
jgi:proline iminopeptidase